MPTRDFDSSGFGIFGSGRLAETYRAAIERMVLARAMGIQGKYVSARDDLADAIRVSMGRTELGVALEVLLSAATGLEGFAGEATSIPRIPFEESVDDFASRLPVTIQPAARRTYQEIARRYSNRDHIAAFVRAADQAVTERVQQLIVKAMREGISEGVRASPAGDLPGIGRLISMGVAKVAEETDAWTTAYATMAFRTNLGTANTEGRIRVAMDPDVRLAVPALMFSAVGDSDTRPNHLAADGVTMSAERFLASRIRPPLGYNCRCRLVHRTARDLRYEGRLLPDGSIREDEVPGGAYPDPGFRT